MKKTCITMIVVAVGSLFLPSCQTAVDPFDLALNQSIARMMAEDLKEGPK